MYLFDADALIDYFTDWPDARTRFRAMLSDGVAISMVTLIEVVTGIYRSADEAHAQREFDEVREVISVLPLDEPTALRTARLREDLLSRGRPIRTRAYDLIVAATALEHDLVLVTANTRDYADIPGLTLLNPRT